MKTSTFRQYLGNVDPRSGNFVCDTISKQVTVSKTQELLIDQKIMEILNKRAIKSVTSYASQIPKQYFPD